jgi:hypothetical protein
MASFSDSNVKSEFSMFLHHHPSSEGVVCERRLYTGKAVEYSGSREEEAVEWASFLNGLPALTVRTWFL